MLTAKTTTKPLHFDFIRLHKNNPSSFLLDKNEQNASIFTGEIYSAFILRSFFAALEGKSHYAKLFCILICSIAMLFRQIYLISIINNFTFKVYYCINLPYKTFSFILLVPDNYAFLFARIS